MLKIKCYDKYSKQWLYIVLGDDWEDHITIEAISSNDSYGRNVIHFKPGNNDTEDVHPERWSDLEQFEIIKE